MIPTSIYFLIIAQLFIISWFDMKEKKILNIWPLVNILIYVVSLFVFPKYYFFSLDVFYLPITFLVVGILLFALKLMGAGDSKYLFSLFLVTPYTQQGQLLMVLLYVTVIVGSSLLLLTILRNIKGIQLSLILKDFSRIKKIFGKKMPFAPLILVSWVWLGIEVVW